VCTIKHILVVEDNIENLELVLCLLENKGYKSEVAIDGEQALELINKYCFDLIILDLKLPKIDGFDVLKGIRRSINSNTPVIAVTACYMKEEEKVILEEECMNCFIKPFNIRKFYDAVAESVSINPI